MKGYKTQTSCWNVECWNVEIDTENYSHEFCLNYTIFWRMHWSGWRKLSNPYDIYKPSTIDSHKQVFRSAFQFLLWPFLLDSSKSQSCESLQRASSTALASPVLQHSLNVAAHCAASAFLNRDRRFVCTLWLTVGITGPQNFCAVWSSNSFQTNVVADEHM